jgi:hypothetical protein
MLKNELCKQFLQDYLIRAGKKIQSFLLKFLLKLHPGKSTRRNETCVCFSLSPFRQLHDHSIIHRRVVEADADIAVIALQRAFGGKAAGADNPHGQIHNLNCIIGNC